MNVPIEGYLATSGLLGCLVAAGWYLHRRGLLRVNFAPGTEAPAVEVKQRAVLNSSHTLHLIRSGDRILLLVTFPGGCKLLDNRPANETSSTRPCGS